MIASPSIVNMLHCNALSGCHQQVCNAHAPLTARNKTDAHGFLRLSTQRHPKTTNSSHGCPRIPAIYNTRALSEHTVKPRIPTDSCNLQYKSSLQAHAQARGYRRIPIHAHHHTNPRMLAICLFFAAQDSTDAHGFPRIPSSTRKYMHGFLKT